jgi:hypothetical protein
MKKEIRTVMGTGVQVTIADERWYSRQGVNAITGLPEIQFVPSVTWIAGHYPKGRAFWMWLADKGWDEAEAIKSAAGDKGSRVHRAIVDLLDGQTVPMDAKVAGSDGVEQELTLEEYDCLRAFRDFWGTCEPVTVARELTVFNAEHDYAGTDDWIGYFRKPPKGFSGGPWVLDWKSGQYVWPEHELQVSAYAHADDIPYLFPMEQPCVCRHIRDDHHADISSCRHADCSCARFAPPLSLGILQVGYRRNKAGWKLTEVEDQFPLFLAAKQIWAKECEGVEPFKKDYPLEISLGNASALRGSHEARHHAVTYGEEA